MKKKGKKGRKGGKKKEWNHLVKHVTVKSSSDLSTWFSVCLSSDNWKVASVCTEPQGDRKHILAGFDRLDNGRKEEQMLSGDNGRRTKRGLPCVRVCVRAVHG